MAGRYTEGLLPPSVPGVWPCLAPLHCNPLCCELEQHLPSLQGRLQWGLALWLKGTLLAHNGCQDSVAVALEPHGCFETVRRALREWTYDDTDRIRSWRPDQEVDVEACFPELLRWVRELWTPDGDVWVALWSAWSTASMPSRICGGRSRTWIGIPSCATPCTSPSDQPQVSGSRPGSWAAVRAHSGWGGHSLRARSLARHADGAARPGPPGALAPANRHTTGADRHGPVCLPPLAVHATTGPVRVARHGLVLAYGTRHEDARDRRLLARNRLWARVWLTPTPRPDRAADLRCLSPPAS